MPLVSVVVPAFNADQTICEVVRSVFAQTECDLELVICDDASTDRTADEVGRFADPRVRLIRNATNLGEGATRDKAIDAAQGQWIAVLDADDAWHPQRLQTLLAAARNDTNVMVFDDLLICHHTKDGLRPWRPMRGADAFGARDGQAIDVPAASWAGARQFLVKPLIPAAALRASGIRHSTLRFSADTEFFLRLVADGMKLRYVPKPFYHYRIMPGSMSATGARAQLMRDMLVRLLPLFRHDLPMLRALERKIAYRDFTMAIKSGRAAEALRLAWRNPQLVTELMARSVAEVPYVFDRAMHGGSSRGNLPDVPGTKS